MKKRGLTLLEILTATIIFSLVILGLTNLFITAKMHILHSRFRMTGGEIGKLFLDPLQMHVRQDTLGVAGNALNTGTTYCDNGIPGHTQNPICPPAIQGRTIDGTPYSSQFIITNLPQNANIRKVRATISWNETRP